MTVDEMIGDVQGIADRVSQAQHLNSLRCESPVLTLKSACSLLQAEWIASGESDQTDLVSVSLEVPEMPTVQAVRAVATLSILSPVAPLQTDHPPRVWMTDCRRDAGVLPPVQALEQVLPDHRNPLICHRFRNLNRNCVFIELTQSSPTHCGGTFHK